jgi:hypothetical protein
LEFCVFVVSGIDTQTAFVQVEILHIIPDPDFQVAATTVISSFRIEEVKLDTTILPQTWCRAGLGSWSSPCIDGGVILDPKRAGVLKFYRQATTAWP